LTRRVDLDLFTIVFLAAAGFLAGAVNAMAGGGSLITFPALLAVGYPSITANVTNAVALCPGYFGGTLAYRPELRGQGRRMAWLAATSVVGGLAGAVLLAVSSEEAFDRIVPFLILFSCALLAAQPAVTAFVRRGGGEGHDVRSPALHVGQLLAAVYGSYFGAGLGVMMLALLGIVLHDSLQRLNALKGFLSLVINVVGAVFFVLFVPPAWGAVLLIAPAALIGGRTGVTLARRLADRTLRALVVGFGTAVGLYLMLD
jgi:uncharacterized membrane protein YfcA